MRYCFMKQRLAHDAFEVHTTKVMNQVSNEADYIVKSESIFQNCFCFDTCSCFTFASLTSLMFTLYFLLSLLHKCEPGISLISIYLLFNSFYLLAIMQAQREFISVGYLLKALNSFMKEVLSYRNQSINLLCKSMTWLLYDRDLRLERLKTYTYVYSTTYLYREDQNQIKSFGRSKYNHFIRVWQQNCIGWQFLPPCNQTYNICNAWQL